MESNWRWNVWASGQVGNKYTLIARCVPPFPEDWAVALWTDGVFRYQDILLIDESGYVAEVIGGIVLTDVSFPWLFDVVPDEPAVEWV